MASNFSFQVMDVFERFYVLYPSYGTSRKVDNPSRLIEKALAFERISLFFCKKTNSLKKTKS